MKFINLVIATLLFINLNVKVLANDSSTSTLDSNLNIDIQSLQYGNENFWAKLNYFGLDSNNIPIWGLSDYGINSSSESLSLDYTLRSGCPRFWRYNGLVYDLPIYDTRNFIEVFIVNDSGEKVLISSLFFNSRSSSSDIAIHENTDDDKREIVKNNTANNLLIECTYSPANENTQSETYRLLVPLKNNNIWEASYSSWGDDTNNLLLEASLLTDLYTKIYFINYEFYSDQETALDNASQFMEETFPNSYYKEILGYHRFNDDRVLLESPTEQQGQYYLFLQDIAASVTSYNVALLNELIAKQYKNYYLSKNDICLHPDQYPSST